MDETLDELGERLHPRHLIEDLIDLFRGDSASGSESRKRIAHGSRRLGHTLAKQIREHPVPALLAGVAIARWIYEATEESEPLRGSSYRGPEPEEWAPESQADWREKAQGAMAGMKGQVTAAASTVGEKVSGAASTVGQRVAGAASTAGQQLSSAAEAGWERVREGGEALSRYSGQGRQALNRQMSAARERFRQTSEDFPLPVGGVFLAAGVLVGLLLPRSEREDEWMGEASDQLKDETLARGESLIEKGKNVAVKTASSAMDEAEARGLTPGELVEKAGSVASEALRAGKEKAREQGIGPADLKEKAAAVARTAAETVKQEGKKETSRPRGA
jgi:hypothetical protein